MKEVSQYFYVIYYYYYYFSSDTNGNCLFSSTSIFLVGDSSLSNILRALTCAELYVNSDFYASHPVFKNLETNHSKIFSMSKLLNICVSSLSLESGLVSGELIREEAFIMCKDKQYSSFLCVLALSTVIDKTICLHYPDFGHDRYKLIFNHTINLMLTC